MDLAAATERLRVAVDAVEKDLAARERTAIGGVRPELMRDPSGRYILLDAYAALVNGLAALERGGA